MKLVKESLNEIKRGGEGSGLDSIGVGKSYMVKQWADKHFDDYTIKDGVIYPGNFTEYPSAERVESGAIPPYIKIKAEKPYRLLKVGDKVKNYNESEPNDYVIVQLFPDDEQSQYDAVVNAYGMAAYRSFKDQMYKGSKVVRTTSPTEPKGNWQIQLYDRNFGVIGDFIYNGDKF
jgi:hypothetical protein